MCVVVFRFWKHGSVMEQYLKKKDLHWTLNYVKNCSMKNMLIFEEKCFESSIFVLSFSYLLFCYYYLFLNPVKKFD